MITGNPEAIANTHPFASLLLELNREEFVAPLIEAISKGVPGESGYLSDYLYALHGLLEGQESLLKVEDHFVHSLGGWLLSTGGGEISWKSGLLLGEIENRSTREYLLKGSLDSSLLHLTRVACLRAIVNHYGEDASEILEKLVDDEDSDVREAALDAKKFVDGRSK